MWAVFTVSCSPVLDEEMPSIDCVPENDEKVNLTFTLILGEQNSASRAGWGDTYESEIGSIAENTINNLQVLLFSPNGNTCYGPLEQTQFFPINDEKSIYEFTGSIPLNAEAACIENNKLNCKIMVFANTSVSITNEADATAIKSVLEAAEFTFSQLNPNPMWGVSTVENVPVKPGLGTMLDPIFVLRSLAKIEVKLDAQLSDYTLEAVTVFKYNTKGYCLPHGYYITNTVGDVTTISTIDKTKDLDQEGVLRANSSPSSESLPFVGTSASGYTIYVPEYKMAEDNSDPYIELTLKNGTETILINEASPKLYFKEYTDGGELTEETFDIVRNHWYRYTITGVRDNDIVLTLSVQNWSVESETMNYEDHVSVTQSGQIKWYIENNEVDPIISDEEQRALVTLKNGSITCQFNIDSPKEGTWYASLNQFGENTNAFKFSSATQTSSDGNNYASVLNNSTASGQCGKGQVTLVIETTGDQPIRVNNMAELQFVVVTSDGRTITVKELLNSTTYGTIDKYTLIQPIQ